MDILRRDNQRPGDFHLALANGHSLLRRAGIADEKVGEFGLTEREQRVMDRPGNPNRLPSLLKPMLIREIEKTHAVLRLQTLVATRPLEQVGLADRRRMDHLTTLPIPHENRARWVSK
jgi:hypothetical protein